MPNQTIQEITTSIIAIFVIVGYFGLAAYQVINHQSITLPSGTDILVGAVAGTYFGKVLAVNGARQAGTAAAQSAVLAATNAGNAVSSKTP